MIKCPNCGKSHYSTGVSTCTAVYYPPIWKDGINVNPDRNTTTTDAHCCECHYDFVIKECAGETWVEEGKYNPPKSPIDVDITARTYETTTEYIPMETGAKLSIAMIDDKGNPLREKTKEEKDIEEIKNEILDIKDQLAVLNKLVFSIAKEVYNDYI